MIFLNIHKLEISNEWNGTQYQIAFFIKYRKIKFLLTNLNGELKRVFYKNKRKVLKVKLQNHLNWKTIWKNTFLIYLILNIHR